MKKIILLLIIGLNISVASAQANLSLSDAIQLCLKNNFDILIESKNISIAQKNNKWSEAGLFPTFSFNTVANYGINDNSNNPFTFQPGVSSNINVIPSINMDWNLFDGMKVIRNKERLVRLENQSKGNSMLVIENTIHSMIRAYYQAVVQKLKVELLREVLEYSKERVAYNEVKKDVGTANSIDVLQFKSQMYTDSMNLVILELNYRNSLRNMNMIMGAPIDSVYVLTDSLTKDLPDVNYDELASLMNSSNQNLKNQYINLELQQTNTKLQGSMMYPTLSFQAQASPNWGWFKSESIDSFLNTSSINYSFSLNLRYTIFNNWKSKRAYKVGKIQEEIQQLRIDDMKLELDNNLRTQIDSYDQRRKLESLSYQNAEFSLAVWELGKEQYSLGSISSFDLTQLRNSYLNTLSNYFDNLYNLVDSYTELYKITGGIVRAIDENRPIVPTSSSGNGQ